MKQNLFFLEIDKVTVGGSENVLLSQEDYDHATATSKPTMMALRFADKLFTKGILKCHCDEIFRIHCFCIF